MNRVLLTGRIFSVEERVVERPGQPPIRRQVVVHPGAVVILPVLDDGRIVMIRNFRHSINEELWELPAGTLEPDETPEQTARRELEEETGYRAAAMTPLCDFYTSPGICTERMYGFAARGLSHVGQRLQGAERITPLPMELADVRGMLLRGELHDGKTIAVLGRFLIDSKDLDWLTVKGEA
jgi:ADP-ribose pyrophosphatase